MITNETEQERLAAIAEANQYVAKSKLLAEKEVAEQSKLDNERQGLHRIVVRKPGTNRSSPETLKDLVNAIASIPKSDYGKPNAATKPELHIPPLVSIVMSAFDRPGQLYFGLDSLAMEIGDDDPEIIVVNDGCHDLTESICHEFLGRCLRIRYVPTHRTREKSVLPRNPCIPNNIAIKAARGDIVILTCPEVILTPGCFSSIVQELLQDENAMVIPQSIYVDDGRMLASLQAGTHFDHQRLPKYDDMAEMPFFLGIWKKHLLAIGGYDEDFTGYACEDVDLIERLKRYGLRHKRVSASAIHLWHGDRCDTNSFYGHRPEWIYNFALSKLKTSIVRNVGREWGQS